MREAWIISTNFLRKIVLQRTLLRNLILRDLRSRYVGSLMGWFWSVIHPLALLLTYTFVFSVVLNLRPWKGVGTDSFAIFLFCGILPWLLFQDTLTRSVTAVIDNANLVKKTRFPVELVPLSIFAANLVSHLIGLSILAFVLLWTGSLGIWSLLLPVYWVWLLFFSVGFGWMLGVLQVFLRDTSQVLTLAVTLWFWFTPIFYTVDLVPAWMRPWLRLNPMAGVVEGYRDCLLLGRGPDPWTFALLGLVSSVVFILGGIVFRVAKREFVDVL